MKNAKKDPKNDPKRDRNIFSPEKCRLKIFHRHFSTNFKSFSPPKKFAQKKVFFSPRGSAGVATPMISLAIPAAIYRSAQGPGPESASRSAFRVVLGTWLGVPQRVFFECFLAFFRPKSAKKHPKSTLWGTPRQLPKITRKALREALSGPGH